MASKIAESVLFFGQSNAGPGGKESPVLTSVMHGDVLVSFASRRTLYGLEEARFSELNGIGPVADHPQYAAMPATATGFALSNRLKTRCEPDLMYFICTIWHGDSSIAAFGKNTTSWNNLMSCVLKSKSELRKSGYDNVVRAVVFIQGENGPWGRAIYRAELTKLLDVLLDDVRDENGQPDNPIALVLQTNKEVGHLGPSTNVELAQWDVVQDRRDAILVGPMYHIPVSDNIHSSTLGRMMLGDLIALVYETVISKRSPFRPLHPISAERQDRRILVRYGLPPQGGPLCWDEEWVAPSRNFGFTYGDSEQSTEIESVRIVGDAEVEILLKDSPRGNAKTIRYAQGQAPTAGWSSARGQLRSGTAERSYFHDLGYAVPEFISHYCIRSEMPVE